MNPDLYRIANALDALIQINQAHGWTYVGYATNIALVLLTGATLFYLIRYTSETQLLRETAGLQLLESQRQVTASLGQAAAAQLQNKQAVMPTVMLESSADLPIMEPGANMPSNVAVLRNVGRGAAFNIEVDTLSGAETKIEFHPVTSLAAGERQAVTMSIREEGKLVHSNAYGHIQRIFHYHHLPSHSPGRITYSDVTGNRYQTILTYRYDDLKKELAPKLDRVEDLH